MRKPARGMRALIEAGVLTASTFLATVPLHADAEIKHPLETGEQFLEYCQSEPADPYSAIGFGVCLGFIQGVAAREPLLPRSQQQFCLSTETSWNDQYDVVVRFISAHPARRNTPASLLLLAALRQAFPCIAD